MKPGETEKFSLVEALSDGTNRSLGATWASDSLSVAVVNQSGEVTAITVGMVAITAASGSDRLMRTLHVVVDISGHYAGQFRITSCTRQSGPGPSPCVAPVTGPLTLDLSQVHDLVTGTMRAFPFYTESGSVSGSVGIDGTAALTATLTGLATSTIHDWHAQATSQGLEGQFTLIQQFTNFFGPQVLLEQAELLGVTKQ